MTTIKVLGIDLSISKRELQNHIYLLSVRIGLILRTTQSRAWEMKYVHRVVNHLLYQIKH